jgi:DNA-binding CsgD family transcriptional regulator
MSAIAAVSSDNQDSSQCCSLALPARDGIGLVATVVPLSRANARQVAPGAFPATAAVIIRDPNASLSFPGEAFAKLYGLTRAEMHVALTMMSSVTLKQVAGCLGISPQTAKTHLQHIFQKTGTSRQADLLALMWRVSAPVL